jgi:hypothetical protein
MKYVKVTKNILKVLFSLSSILGIGSAIVYSVRSQLFLIERIEVVRIDASKFSSNYPLSNQDILNVASIPLRKVNLFTLNVREVQQKLMALEWIVNVEVCKQLPSTLLLGVRFRDPRAILQTPDGLLLYVDQFGNTFGKVSFIGPVDLPLLTGFSDAARLKQALRIVDRWESSEVNRLSWLSSVYWESGRGFRILVGYLSGRRGASVRSMVDLGQEIDGSLDSKIIRIGNVISYLSSKSILARQIYADGGKKVVVKTLPDS